MVKQLIYSRESEIPPIYHKQIIEFLRTTWPDGFQGDNQKRNWIGHPEEHAKTFILVDDDVLISHVSVVWKNIIHKGVTYKMYALSGMFTYPQFRKRNYGSRILHAAMDYVLLSDADVVFIHSKLEGFYEKAGLMPNKKVRTLVGKKTDPVDSNEPVLTIFLSEKGKKGQRDFESQPFYFGEDLW